MAAAQGESSDVSVIEQELEEQYQSFLNASQDLQGYDTSIDAAAAEAHSAVDGSKQKDVEELYDLIDEAKVVFNEVSCTAEKCAAGVRGIIDRL